MIKENPTYLNWLLSKTKYEFKKEVLELAKKWKE